MTLATLDPKGYCPYCSNPDMQQYVFHTGVCPKIKSIERYPDGTIKKVEFKGS